jgi:hypothetical protein
MRDLDESLATFALHTPVQRHDSTQLFSLDQAWDGIEQTLANDPELQSLNDMFLIVSWEAPAVSPGSWQTPSYEPFLNPAMIDQQCVKVVYEQISDQRLALKPELRTISRKRSATLTQLEDRPDAKRTQSMDMS